MAKVFEAEVTARRQKANTADNVINPVERESLPKIAKIVARLKEIKLSFDLKTGKFTLDFNSLATSYLLSTSAGKNDVEYRALTNNTMRLPTLYRVPGSFGQRFPKRGLTKLINFVERLHEPKVWFSLSRVPVRSTKHAQFVLLWYLATYPNNLKDYCCCIP